MAGTGVFLTAHTERVPLVLQRHLTHNKVLPQEVVLVAVIADEVPKVEEAGRLRLEALPQGPYRVRAYYGFMETPNVREIIARCRNLGLDAPAGTPRTISTACASCRRVRLR